MIRHAWPTNIIISNTPGFHGLATSGKLGLAGIQERVNFLNGDFRISSSPGRGTSLFIEVKC